MPALVGYSWAGLLAFEAARQLLNTEGIKCYTALIGADAPLRPTNFISRSIHFARYFPRWLWDTITNPQHRWRRLTRWPEMARGIKQSLFQARWPMVAPSPISRHMMELLENYRPLPKSDLSVWVFRERDEDYYSRPHPLHNWLTPQLPDAGWNYWTRRPNHIYWLAGDHNTILKQPAVGRTGAGDTPYDGSTFPGVKLNDPSTCQHLTWSIQQLAAGSCARCSNLTLSADCSQSAAAGFACMVRVGTTRAPMVGLKR